jgi:imidazoleglycerol-phosphate dehydratase
MNERTAQVKRQTAETSVVVALNVDGKGIAEVHTGIGFLDHMLDALARHASFDLSLQAEGDLQVDAHHTVEDTAISLGCALAKALGDCAGIRRMAHAVVPLDEALALVAVDVSGRGYAVVEADFDTPRLGQLGTDLIWHFIESLAHSAHITIHARVLAGRNDHHKAEALFKALARALGDATRIDDRLAGRIPSTKGAITVES